MVSNKPRAKERCGWFAAEGSDAMLRSLGPHSFASVQPHERHPAWLHSFSAKERHELIREDATAKFTVGFILGAAVVFHLTMLTIVLVFFM
jgi:hypothetical protein